MTITRIVALLSILALLASLPLTVALAQEGGEGEETPDASSPSLPYVVVGFAMLDDAPAMADAMVVAMIGDDKVGSGTVMGMEGAFSVNIKDAAMGAMVTFALMMGEGDEAMEYMAMSQEDVMIGMPGGRSDITNLMASSTGDVMMPGPTKTAEETAAAMRGPTGPRGPQGEAGTDGADGAAGARGPDGAAGSSGADGSDGANGARGSDGEAGSSGSDGADGSDGTDGTNGARGPAGATGPAGADGATGTAGTNGAAGADGGGGILVWIALIVAIVGVVAAGGAFIAGRQSAS